jgi:hypothetical protein
MTVILSGVDPSLAGSQGRIHVTIAGVDQPGVQITAGTIPGTLQVSFQLTQSSGGAGVPLVVTVDSAHTDPYTVSIH